ncbi:MAG: pantoate--beta-alanine ligase [Candidatus Puniceispirillales bacterium]
MIIARTRDDLNQTLQKFTQKPGKLALIPTMGNLHDGHLSLVRLAKLNAKKTITTIFVNPLQFGKNEDFEKYPRSEEMDIKKLSKEKCDILFIPVNRNEVFPKFEEVKKIESGKLGNELCGKIRPGHFDGVLTVVNKIFDIIKPDIAIFGAKDYQQHILISEMSKILHPYLTILKAPIIRSKNGVALSSRNNYLSEKEMNLASNLFKCLENSVKLYKDNVLLSEIIENAKKFLISKKLNPDYLELRDNKLNNVNDNNFIGKKVFLSSVTLNKTRLIDNIEF